MPYNFVADSFHTHQAKCDLRGKTAVLRSSPTYDDHLRLIGKRVGDFLLVLIELFR